MKNWKVALIGAGYMAQEHAKAFASLPYVKIVGVCSRTQTRAMALASQYGATVFTDIAAMYQATDADAVVVAVNELSMQEVCYECFKFPWICLLEKPVGVDLAQAKEIHAIAERVNARVYVAFNRRSYASTRNALIELTDEPGPRLVSIFDQQDMASARSNGKPERVVRNYMFANSIHLIDYLTLFGRGEIESVQVVVPWTPEQPRYVVAAIKFSSGDIGVYQAVWDGPGPWAVTVTNQQHRIELRPLESLAVQRRGERQQTVAQPDRVDTDYKPGLLYQAEQLVAALAGRPFSLATLSEATRSMTLCAHIYGLCSHLSIPPEL